jgi:hypothetical protein
MPAFKFRKFSKNSRVEEWAYKATKQIRICIYLMLNISSLADDSWGHRGWEVVRDCAIFQFEINVPSALLKRQGYI